MNEYVTTNDAGATRLTGTRVSLASIVHAFWRGETPESIAQSFPSLGLEQVYGAIAYYLAHRDHVDREMDRREKDIAVMQSSAAAENRALRERLLRSRIRA